MSALELITVLSQAMYVVVFLLVTIRWVRVRTRAHLDMVLFFGILAFLVIETRIAALLGITVPEWFTDTIIAAVIAMPYVLLRLVDDFTTVRPLTKRAAEAAGVLLAAAAYVIPGTLPTPYVLAIVAYIAGLSFYSGWRFVRASAISQGVTKRRLQAISAGTILFGLQILAAGLGGQSPEPMKTVLAGTGQFIGLIAAIAFFIGFAPPGILRRAWQAPELRNFLSRAASLPRLPRTLDIVRELERGAAAATGSRASIGLWEEDERKIRLWDASEAPFDIEPGQHFAGRAYEQQHTIFSAMPVRDDPQGAELYRRERVGAVIATPITAGERRVGVLVLYAERPPIFAVSDRELAQLLADQAAVILESRMLIDHATRVRAREEATRLKEDFLSSAAHDLKTPLTTVVAQAQYLERKALRDPAAPADLTGIQRISREGQRLAALVTDLLDAARLEQGRLVSDREPVDLGALVTAVVARQTPGAHTCELDVQGAVVGDYDARRIEQLVDNLIENAKKYSPEATPVSVTVSQRDGEAHIVVRDRGIGIPAADLPLIFERFSRGSNVNDRKFHGMGLGLYICRGIVEEHGGRIWAESELGKGSTFHVALPVGGERRSN
ncbi:MAG TPA: ATP-binding protein [Candidatus Limnocylindrales bacterium]|nr:ATP-binding protein [Candidatus Limnocylindrales bacterium]